MPKKKKKKTFTSSARGNPISKGKVVAVDFKYTGTEPTWGDWKDLTDDEFISRRSYMLQFYNYYLNHKYLIPDLIDWMKENAYSRDDIRKIKSLPDNSITFTHKKLVRAMNQGMPGEHQSYIKAYGSHSDKSTIKSAIASALSMIPVEVKSDEEEEPIVKKLSPYQLTLDKVNREVIVKLDGMLDAWILLKDSKVKGLSLLPILTASNVKGAALQTVIDWLTRQFNEIDEAYNKSNADSVEGYNHLSRGSLKSRHTELKKMLADCEKRSLMSKVERKSRQKKTPSIAKQVEGVKYLKHDGELGMQSLSPDVIPTAINCITYNTKNRTLSYFKSVTGGLTVRGSTIYSIDESESYNLKIRKPEDLISNIQKLTPKRCLTQLNKLTTKKAKCSGRLNEHTLILKTW